MKKEVNLVDILEQLDHELFVGQMDVVIRRIVSLKDENIGDDCISWCSAKHINQIAEKKNGSFIVPHDVSKDLLNETCNYILVKNPRSAFRKLLNYFIQDENDFEGVIIGSNATVHIKIAENKNLRIGSNVVIEEDCFLGNYVSIDSNTVIKKGTVIHDHVSIGSNCTIGGVGFGYEKDESGRYEVIPHIGNVVIHQGAEIGNNTCIDRAVMGSTIIGENVKVDNLVHIAHGVNIGKNSLIIANSMVAGSCVIGENVWVAPSTSILNGLEIKDDSVIGLGAVVIKPVDANQVIVGNPGRAINKS